MEVKIIKSEADNSLIVWNPFRESYTKLMSTVPHLIECRIKAEIDTTIKVKIILNFSILETELGQDSTRAVIQNRNEFPFTLNYKLDTPQKHIDTLLPEYFEKFWEDYINHSNKENDKL